MSLLLYSILEIITVCGTSTRETWFHQPLSAAQVNPDSAIKPQNVSWKALVYSTVKPKAGQALPAQKLPGSRDNAGNRPFLRCLLSPAAHNPRAERAFHTRWQPCSTGQGAGRPGKHNCK